jgi:hypothetical protein
MYEQISGIHDTPRSLAFREIYRSIKADEPGCTANLLGNDLPTKGYFVGGTSWTMVTDYWTVSKRLTEFFAEHKDASYIEFWRHNGKIYLDEVTHHAGLSEALFFGELRSEIAIWDIENKREINVKEACDQVDID